MHSLSFHSLRIALAASLAASSALPASALTLRNLEPKPQTVTLIEGGEERTLTVGPKQPLAGICPKGCIVELNNGDRYAFDGPEAIALEDGLLFFDELAD
jgi:hypothetical protein